MAKKQTTRSESYKFLIGSPSSLPRTMLPMKTDVLRALELCKNAKDYVILSKDRRREICFMLTNEQLEIWQRSSVPTVPKNQISRKVDLL